MKLTWGRRRPAEKAPTPTPRPCGHSRVEPHTVTNGVNRPSTLRAVCMDCGKPADFDLGVMIEPQAPKQWSRVMRANGYMQNAANKALWEKML